MPEYRAYFLNEDDHIVGVVELVCADDAAAVVEATQLVDGHDVELWQTVRKVARLERNK